MRAGKTAGSSAVGPAQGPGAKVTARAAPLPPRSTHDDDAGAHACALMQVVSVAISAVRTPRAVLVPFRGHGGPSRDASFARFSGPSRTASRSSPHSPGTASDTTTRRRGHFGLAPICLDGLRIGFWQRSGIGGRRRCDDGGCGCQAAQEAERNVRRSISLTGSPFGAERSCPG